MNNKYNLTKKDNIFLANKLLLINVYNSAKLEALNVTFQQTKTMLEGMSVSNVDIEEVQTVLNLRNAWKFMLSNVDAQFDLVYMEKVNGFVAYNESLEWGTLRNGEVGIGGVDYRPEIPARNQVKSQITTLLQIENVTERAIKLMLNNMRNQYFWDGNKRTSIICANKILIQNGKGILTISENHLEEFNIRLSEFYESNDYKVIFDFLYEQCIVGMGMENEL